MPLKSLRSNTKEESGLTRLRELLEASKPAGLDRLVHAYGSAERCYRCYLNVGEKDKKYDAASAAAGIEETLAFRKELKLDSYRGVEDTHAAFESHRLRPRLPLAFAGTAPDGAVVQYARLSSFKAKELVSAASGEGELRNLVALWLEHALRLQGESTRARAAPCPGTYDVYDLAGVNMWKLVWECKETRGTLGPILNMGETHYPNNLYRCFIINASGLFTGIWKVIKPFLSQRTQQKVTISTHVPKDLVDAMGGAAKVEDMMATVPEAPQKD